MLNGEAQTLYAFAEQEDKVPVDQPLHIVSHNEGNLALVILNNRNIKGDSQESLFLLLDRMFALSIAGAKSYAIIKL